MSALLAKRRRLPLQGRCPRSGPLPVVLALLTLLAVLPALGAQGALASGPGCAAGIGTRVPLLKVHGYSGSAADWNVGSPTMIAALGQLPQVYQASFDYSEANRQWVTDSRIGPALAAKIACLAASSRAEGGAGKVIVVAHSMGGLATREAASMKVDGQSISDLLGLVITLGTPNKGSFLVPGGAAPPEAVLTKLVAAACYVSQVGANLLGNLYNYCQLPDSSDPASRAFVPGSPQLSALPTFPASVPVRAIAGVIDTLRIQVVHTTLSLGSVGDGVVGQASALFGAAHPELGGGPVQVHCGAWRWPVGLPACYHGNEPSNAQIINQVLQGVRTYLAAAAPPPIPAAAQVSLARCYYPGDRPQVRPTSSLIGCDGTGSLYAMRWSDWTADTADGTGILTEPNGCNPDCASAVRYDYPVAVHLDRPITVPAGAFFSRAAFTFPGAAPPVTDLGADSRRQLQPVAPVGVSGTATAVSQEPCLNDGPCIYHLYSDGGVINMRSAPTVSAPVVTTLAKGAALNADCSVEGGKASGPGGLTSSQWERVDDGLGGHSGYVSDVFLGVFGMRDCRS